MTFTNGAKGKFEGQDEGFESGYLTCLEAFEVPAKDPKRKVLAILPFPNEVSESDDQEAENTDQADNGTS